MTDNELAAIVNAKLTNSLGFMGSVLSDERLEALKYYKGEPFGDETEGKSKVVVRVTAEAVDSMLPPLLKPFTSTGQIAVFEPSYKQPRQGETPQQAAKRADNEAKCATDRVNYEFWKRNNGFLLLHNWAKDALYQKNGIVKSWWDETIDTTQESYDDLDDASLAMLKQDPEIKIVTTESRPDPSNPVTLLIMLSPNQTIQPPQLHNVTCKRTRKHNQVRIMNVPPDEFLIDRRAVSLEEAPFLCHRAKHTVSELKLMFPEVDKDIIDDLPGNDATGDWNKERIERFADEGNYPFRDDAPGDPSMREVWLNECYIRTDYNDDGYAELRQVFTAGDINSKILSNEEVDDHPFNSWTPYPMPHKFFGMDVADQTMDIQRIQSTILRGGLNSIYLGNEPMYGVIDGEVNMDDLMNRRAGGVVRLKNSNSVVPMPTINVSSDAFNMLGYMDSLRESRTGVKRFTSTLQRDQIMPYGQSATAASLMDNANNDRLECIAKIWAETGIKPLAKRILELICKHSEGCEARLVGGQPVVINPREWDTQMDLTVQVGLGTANKDARWNKLMAIAPLYQALANSPLVQKENGYAFLMELCKSGELNPPEKFFTDPSTLPPQPPQGQAPPDPKAAAAAQALQAKTQATQAKAQSDMAIQQAKAKAGIDLQTAQMHVDMQEQATRAKSDMAIDVQDSQTDAQLQRQKMDFDMQLQREKAAHEMQLEQLKAQHAMEVARINASNGPRNQATGDDD